MSSPLSSSAMISPEASAGEQARKELQNKLTGLGGLNGRQISPEAKAKKLREACEGFESIFIQKMWQEMRNTIPKGGMMHGKEERFWQDMYDQELSKSMTSAGGIGLADMMYEQLSRNLVSASRSAAGSVSGAVFTPAAAPLVAAPQNSVYDSPAESAPARAVASASVYEGAAPQAAPAEPEAAMERPDSAPAAAVQSVAQAAPAAARPANERQAAPRSRSRQRYNNNSLELSQIAMRDAGDKLGPGAVRPALHHRPEQRTKTEKAREVVEPPVQAEAPAPGSPEALRAAMLLAKSGQAQSGQVSASSMNDIVARVQAQNAQAASQATMMAASAAQTTDSAASQEPVTRRVRFSTNIPGKNKNKKNNQLIRMLNVDNVGVNSKAGKGLAAYHAQQEAAAEAQAGASSQTLPGNAGQSQNAGDTASAGQTIMPLTAASASGKREDEPGGANFSIPPLTSADLRG